MSEHQIRRIISAEKGGVTEAQVRQFISEDSGLANNNALMVMIQDLEDKLERVEGRVSCVPVMIGDEIFQSKEDLTTFIQKSLPSNKFEYVLDALSLMEVVTDESSSFQEVMKQKEWTFKGKFRSPQVAKVVASYTLELPSMFGKGEASTHPLPALKTYKHWNPHSLHGGVKGKLKQSLARYASGYKAIVSTLFQGEANRAIRNLCLITRKDADEFVQELCTFIDEFYLELVGDYDCSGDEAWSLVGQLVKQIFTELNKVRAVAREALNSDDPEQVATLILWGAMCAHRVQQDFLNNKFRYHPSLAPIVNLHLFRHRVSPDKFISAQEKLEKTIGVVKKLQMEMGTVQNKLKNK